MSNVWNDNENDNIYCSDKCKKPLVGTPPTTCPTFLKKSLGNVLCFNFSANGLLQLESFNYPYFNGNIFISMGFVVVTSILNKLLINL